MKIYYNSNLKQLARELRKNSTVAEIVLWNNLKGKRFYGFQFMRQKPIGEYIVDFFCSKLKLMVFLTMIVKDMMIIDKENLNLMA